MGGAAEAPDGGGGGDVPEEDGAVAAGRDETFVVRGDGEGEDFIAVGGVSLDEAAFGDGGAVLGGLLGDIGGGVEGLGL